MVVTSMIDRLCLHTCILEFEKNLPLKLEKKPNYKGFENVARHSEAASRERAQIFSVYQQRTSRCTQL